MAESTVPNPGPPDDGVRWRTDSDDITVLHVDDDADFASTTAAFLERRASDIEAVTETDPDAVLDRLDDGDGAVDCVVSDYQMPGTDGLELLERVRGRYPDLPFILFTGRGSEEVAGNAISAGVTDYLQKGSGLDQYAVLTNRVRNAVGKSRSERTLRRLLSALETIREGVSLVDEDGRFVYVNGAFADALGYDPAEMLGERWQRRYPEDAAAHVTEAVLPDAPAGGVWRTETTMLAADDSPVAADSALSYTPDGLLVCTVVPTNDAA